MLWYRAHGRHNLEWRDYGGDDSMRWYRVWMSEVFLQQTQVERVRTYFMRILDRYPTIHDLAKATYDEFFPYYQGMWYYSRARNLLAAARIVSGEYRWIFPREKSLLSKLPGVWEYTSSAILAFAYGEVYLAWDTNLEKVFARYYHGRKDEKLTNREKELIEEDFRWYVSHRWDIVRSINNALMDFGACVDLKNPDHINWENYPLKNGRFYKTRGSLEPKETKKSQSFPTPDATIIVILHEAHKHYYCERSDTYSPFFLSPALTRDTRWYIQDYFRERYRLELSVRPAHKKWISADGIPYIAVNAQIQTGDTDQFTLFPKPGAQDTLGKIIP